KLRLIERSELSRGAFMNGIGAMTTDIVEKARSFTEDGIENKETDIPNPIDGGNLIETFRAYKSKDGKFTIYKTIGNRKMTEDEVRELVTKGSVGPLDGFRSKLGKPFSATLKLDENFALKFHFGDGQDSSDRKPENLAEAPVVAKCPRSAMGLCSCKDGVLVATDTAYVCRSDSSPEKKCSFRLGKNMLSHVITITELESLATTGKTPVIDDFVSKRTKKKFSAALALDQKGGISFEFAKKIRKGGQ
ncbi:MAG: topoisomerase C-terminal repeat-containing protein, partial [Opitutales bacterium]|nr:topoisomerase C-terminal repeat-containing protein [Opitutales bacterium]